VVKNHRIYKESGTFVKKLPAYAGLVQQHVCGNSGWSGKWKFCAFN